MFHSFANLFTLLFDSCLEFYDVLIWLFAGLTLSVVVSSIFYIFRGKY